MVTGVSPRASSLSSVSLASLNSVGLIFSQRWYRSCPPRQSPDISMVPRLQLQEPSCLQTHVHLNDFTVALIADSTVVVPQQLSQQANTLLHLLNDVHPL